MTLLVTRDNPQEGGIPLPENARVVALLRPGGQGLWRKLSVSLLSPYYFWQIARSIVRADVVHTPLPGDIPFLGLLVGVAFRKRLIARYAGSWATTSQTTLMNRVTKTCLRILAGGRIVVLATGMGAAAPASRTHWIFASAITEEEVSSLEPNLDWPVSFPLRLVYAGRLSPEKGVIDLIKAIGLLAGREDLVGRIPQLTIVGGGSLRAKLGAQVRELRCDDFVEFAGQLNRNDLFSVLQRADLCVLPSLTESFCKARLDAMLCGVPVVTTPVGFGREIVGCDGERGWIVPPQDPEGLADLLARIITSPPHWGSLRRRCREYAEGRTLEAWVGQIGDICAGQWNLSLVGGHLCERTPVQVSS